MEATHPHGARARGGMPRQSRGGKSWRAAGAGVLLACALDPAPAAAWTVIPAVSARARAPQPGSRPRAPQTRPGIACSQRGSLCVCGAPALLGSA